MKETIMKKYRLLNRIMNRISENHTGAYAAQSAFFIVLSMIPFIMLLLALVQYTPVTKADVIRAVTHVLPKTIYDDCFYCQSGVQSVSGDDLSDWACSNLVCRQRSSCNECGA
mgnify:FL=1